MNDAAKRHIAQITLSQRAAVGYLERLCDGATTRLWKGNVIHGEQFLTKKGHAVFMADVSTALLRLCAASVIRPIAFQPSHSGAAFLGLDSCQQGAHTTPNASDAAHWDWEVTGEFAVLTLED